MKITSFNKKQTDRVAELNSYLKENFGVRVKPFSSKSKLEKVLEQAQSTIDSIKGNNKKFQADPNYAKFLGIRDLVNIMLSEGQYAEGAAYEAMCNEVRETVRNLMDSGYTDEEACAECMNRFRKNPRYAHSDDVVSTIVLKAAKDYMEETSGGAPLDAVVDEAFSIPETDINENLLRELAKEVGVELSTLESLDAIEEKISSFAEVTGKSRDAVVGFLNGLEEDALQSGIQMFGRKIAEANAFVKARKDAIAAGKKEFEVDGKMYTVTGDTTDEVEESSMFDDIIDSLLVEEVAVEQAEVVMAIRALSDDIQDQVERLGRMINEDLPAISDQASAEFGAEQAAGIKGQMEQSLQALLDASKAGKDAVDSVVGMLTGTGTMAEPMAEPMADAGMEEPMDEPVDNIPAASGPEEEPLGRAPVEEL